VILISNYTAQLFSQITLRKLPLPRNNVDSQKTASRPCSKGKTYGQEWIRHKLRSNRLRSLQDNATTDTVLGADIWCPETSHDYSLSNLQFLKILKEVEENPTTALVTVVDNVRLQYDNSRLPSYANAKNEWPSFAEYVEMSSNLINKTRSSANTPPILSILHTAQECLSYGDESIDEVLPMHQVRKWYLFHHSHRLYGYHVKFPCQYI